MQPVRPVRAGDLPAALPSPIAARVDGPIEQALKTVVSPTDLAAIIIEPVLGEGGFVVPPPAFLHELRALADAHGIVLIIDEVQSGFGRTGKMFAIEHVGIEPDLMTLAKSMGAGTPLAAVVGRASLMDTIQPGGVGGTYGGNPVACAAALEAIRIIEGLVTSGRAAALGARLRARLDQSRSRIRSSATLGVGGDAGHRARSRSGDAGTASSETSAIVATARRRVAAVPCGHLRKRDSVPHAAGRYRHRAR